MRYTACKDDFVFQARRIRLGFEIAFLWPAPHQQYAQIRVPWRETAHRLHEKFKSLIAVKRPCESDDSCFVEPQ